jgi:hypothetical protein
LTLSSPICSSSSAGRFAFGATVPPSRKPWKGAPEKAGQHRCVEASEAGRWTHGVGLAVNVDVVLAEDLLLYADPALVKLVIVVARVAGLLLLEFLALGVAREPLEVLVLELVL